MKNLLSIIYVNVRRMLKDPAKIGFMALTPFLVILFVNFISSDSGNNSALLNISVAYNVEDNGDVWKDVFPYIAEDENIFINEKEKALELLEKDAVSVVYNIPSDFSELVKEFKKPNIKAYKVEDGNTTIPIEIKINEDINKWIEREILIDQGIVDREEELSISSVNTVLIKDGAEIDGDINVATVMIIYFIILGSSFIGSELIELKDKNIISRAISTPNNSFTILGGLVFSMLFFQVGINMIILLIGKLVLDYQIFHLHIIFINIILASMFSITLSLAVTRIFKNAGVVSLITALISVITLFLSMFAQEGLYKSVPKFISNLGKFTPQYWIFDSLEKSVLFPNVFIVLLIIMTLFTAGSYRLKDF